MQRLVRKVEQLQPDPLWQRPRSGFEYIHPRYDVSGVEIPDPWGFKQNDAIGILLYKIAHLEKKGVGILRSHASMTDSNRASFRSTSCTPWSETPRCGAPSRARSEAPLG